LSQIKASSALVGRCWIADIRPGAVSVNPSSSTPRQTTGLRGTGKPLQIEVDQAPNTTGGDGCTRRQKPNAQLPSSTPV